MSGRKVQIRIVADVIDGQDWITVLRDDEIVLMTSSTDDALDFAEDEADSLGEHYCDVVCELWPELSR